MEIWKPIRDQITKITDPDVNMHEKRKLLRKGEIGEGVFNGLADLGLPMLRDAL